MGIRENTPYEGGPYNGDLIVNILLGFTVICLPLTVGSVVRAVWLRYCITGRHYRSLDSSHRRLGRMRSYFL